MHRFLDVDPAAATPIWNQIEDGMRRLVASGRLTSGAVVPSVRELSRALRVNPATVSKAYRRLTEAGLLTVRRGEGTFVADLAVGELAALKRELLATSAAAYVRVAVNVGAGRDEAVGEIERRWEEVETDGGEGERDE